MGRKGVGEGREGEGWEGDGREEEGERKIKTSPPSIPAYARVTVKSADGRQ